MGRPVSRRAIAGWLLFDWAAQPYYTLVLTFVFAPFFVSALAADPVSGQASWGFATAVSGLLIAFLSPALGAIADAAGGRKPWIAFFSGCLVAGSILLWFAEPGSPNAVPLALAGFVLGAIGAEFATVFTNSMMPDLVPENRLGRLSGYGWAAGYFGGLVSLVLVLGFMAARPETGVTILGLEPVFGLDPVTREGDRASGPFTALWYLIFVLPLFLFTPDVPRRRAIADAVRAGLAELRTTLVTVHRQGSMLTFLIANMIYKDGLAALFAFGGIYAAGLFGWTTIQIGLFGIFLTITGTVGAVVGGILDDRMGPKAVVSGSLVLLCAASIGILSIRPDELFFVLPVAPPVADGALFASAAELTYLAFGGLIGIAAGPLQASSRTLLVRLAPRENMTEYFGLFALSGKVTSFAAPALVAAVTVWADSQRIGIAMILIFFVLGLAVLARVRMPSG
ncbi:MAG: MFS transporter [Pseudomonadota bacterium]